MERVQSDAESASQSEGLLKRAVAGDQSAVNALWIRHLPRLRRWAHGRLPKWARRFADTGDIVQDALLRTFRRLDKFEPRGQSALQAYLREAVRNRITDEVRRASRQPTSDALDTEISSADPSPFQQAAESEERRRYEAALLRLDDHDRELVVSRLELHYSYDQIALMTERPTSNAARVAVRRAIVKLVDEMDRV